MMLIDWMLRARGLPRMNLPARLPAIGAENRGLAHQGFLA